MAVISRDTLQDPSGIEKLKLSEITDPRIMENVIDTLLSYAPDIMHPLFLEFEESYLKKETKRSKIEWTVKSLGHRFSLDGSVPHPENKEEMISFTGFNSILMALEMSKSINNFLLEFSSEMDYETKRIFQKMHLIIRKALRHAFIPDVFNKLSHYKIFEDLLNQCKEDIALILTGYEGHGVCIIIVQGKFLYVNNMGICSFGNNIVQQFEITNPDNLNEQLLKTLVIDVDSVSNKTFIHQDLHVLLGLKPIGYMEGAKQEVGNCAWASLKTALRCLLSHFQHEEKRLNEKLQNIKMTESKLSDSQDHRHKRKRYRFFPSIFWSNPERISKDVVSILGDEAEDIDNCVAIKPCGALFTAWEEYDQMHALNEFMDEYQNSPILPYVLRRIITTQCVLENEHHFKIGRKIFKFLSSLQFYSDSVIEYMIRFMEFQFHSASEKAAQLDKFFPALTKSFPDENRHQWSTPLFLFFHAILNNNLADVKEKEKTLNCDPRDVHYLGWNPLHLAARVGNLNILVFLLHLSVGRTNLFVEQSSPCIWLNQTNDKGFTPLHYSVNNEVIRFLLSKKATVSTGSDRAKSSVLGRILSSDNNQILAEVLPAIKASETNKTESKRDNSSPLLTSIAIDALHAAIAWQSVSGVENLINQHPKLLFAKDYEHHSPLHTAVMHKNHPVVSLLLSRKASINQRDINGNTALHHAIHQKDDNLVNKLLEEPLLDLYTRNFNHLTAWGFARRTKNEPLQILLHTKMTEQVLSKYHWRRKYAKIPRHEHSTPEHELLTAIRLNDVSGVKTCLIDLGVDINSPEKLLGLSFLYESINVQHNKKKVTQKT